MIRGVLYSLKQAFRQGFRNKGMTLASVFAITAMMLILALFFFLTVNVSFLTENVKDQVGTIEVYLKEETTKEQAANMIASIGDMAGVEKAEYISKEQAMEAFKTSWGRYAYLLDTLSENPLPNSIRITLSEIETGDFIATAAEGLPGVEDVRFLKEEVDKVINVSNIIQKGALIVIIFLVIVAVVVVSNTIKLTVMARQDEIRNMRYVGATNWFIRGPMFIEGIVIGCISAVISIVLSALIYTRLCDLLSEQTFRLFTASLVEPQFLIKNIIWIFLALGISIGACGSIVSMRRYLKS